MPMMVSHRNVQKQVGRIWPTAARVACRWSTLVCHCSTVDLIHRAFPARNMHRMHVEGIKSPLGALALCLVFPHALRGSRSAGAPGSDLPSTQVGPDPYLGDIPQSTILGALIQAHVSLQTATPRGAGVSRDVLLVTFV